MIVLDATHYLYRNVFPNAKSIKENPNFVAHLMLQGYLKQIRDFSAAKDNRMIVALDSKPSWRHYWFEEHSQDFPEYRVGYKGSRKNTLDVPWDQIWDVYTRLHDMLDQCSDIEVVKERMAEADDIVYVAARYARERGEQCFIVSSDKDFRQLQDEPNVNIYDPIKCMFIPKLDPERYLALHIIMGDKGDDILPIRPQGKSRTMSEGPALKIYKKLDTILATEPDVKARWEFNRKMIDLTQIPTKLYDTIEQKVNTVRQNYDFNGMMEIMKEFQLRKLSQNISDFSFRPNKIATKKNTHYERENFEETAENALSAFFQD